MTRFLAPPVLPEQSSAPGTPASGLIVLYAKTDGRLYGKDDTGTEFAFGDALLAAANNWTNTQTISAGGLVVSAGNFQVDSAGRVGLGTAVAASRMLVLLNGTAHPGTASVLFGTHANVVFPATTTGTGVVHSSQLATVASAFTMGTGYVYYADTPSRGAGSTITDLVAFKAVNHGATGITNAYGIDIDGQSGATTINVAARLRGGTTANLWLDSDTASSAGGIAAGTSRDTSLFRSAAGIWTASGLVVSGGPFLVDSTGRIGLFGAVQANIGINVGWTHPGTTATLYGVNSDATLPATATTLAAAYRAAVRTVATSFSVADSVGFFAESPTVGAGSTLSNNHGVKVANQGGTGVTNAIGIHISAQSGASGVNVPIRVDGPVEVAEVATPATPASGYGRFYFKSDGKPYSLNDAGTETDLTAGTAAPPELGQLMALGV